MKRTKVPSLSAAFITSALFIPLSLSFSGSLSPSLSSCYHPLRPSRPCSCCFPPHTPFFSEVKSKISSCFSSLSKSTVTPFCMLNRAAGVTSGKFQAGKEQRSTCHKALSQPPADDNQAKSPKSDRLEIMRRIKVSGECFPPLAA